MNTMKRFESFQSRNLSYGNETPYIEIEFVCQNTDYDDATPPEKQYELYKALKAMPRFSMPHEYPQEVLVYMCDASYVGSAIDKDGEYHQVSLSIVILHNTLRKEIRKMVYQIAKKIGVKVDLEQPVSYNTVDSILDGSHEDLMTEADINTMFTPFIS